MSIGESDLHRIAGSLSGLYGTFPVDGLVNYGETVLVKPGVTTEDGHLFTGAEVQRRLGADWQVFPMAVEYNPGPMAAMELFGTAENDLKDLETELDAIGAGGGEEADELLADLNAAMKAQRVAEEAFRRGQISSTEVQKAQQATVDAQAAYESATSESLGGHVRRSAKLEKKYMEALAKFAKCQTLLASGKGRSSFLRKLATVAVPFSFLVANSKDRRVRNRAKHCDGLYKKLIDVRQHMERKGIDVSRLPRPEDFLTGMANRSLSAAPATARPVPFYPGVPARPATGPAAFYPVYPGRPALQPAQPAPGTTYTPVSQAYLRDQAELEREMSAQMPSYGGVDAETPQEEIENLKEGYQKLIAMLNEPLDPTTDALDLHADLRAETIGFLHSQLEHDYYGLGGSEFEALYDDGRFAQAEILLNDSEEKDLIDDDILEGEILGTDAGSGNSDDDLVSAVMNDDAGIDTDDAGHPMMDASTEEAAQRLAAFRSILYQRLGAEISEGADGEKCGSLSRQIEAATKKLASENRSLDYARLQPQSVSGMTSKCGPVVMVGIRKRARTSSLLDAIGFGRSSMGELPVVRSPRLIDTFGASLYRAKQGYSPLEASVVMREFIRPEDQVRGSFGASAPFPDGDGAPLPPPRRVGAEVTG